MTPLQRYTAARLEEAPSRARQALLEPIARDVAATPRVQLLFLCTHNSRRSQFAQVWAQLAARRFGLPGVKTFSGGTEVTACDPRTLAALQRAGFDVVSATDADNPRHVVTGEPGLQIACFSKRFDDAPNPVRGFVAVSTCSDVDAACPVVPGAAARHPLPYVDPKHADGTAAEAKSYDVCCAAIATEMLWLMRRAAALQI